MKNENRISHAKLVELLSYSPETGEFRWCEHRGGTAYAGSLAGNLRAKDGYIQIKVERRLYLAHQLAMFYVNGEWPEHEIDHINGIRSDNRLCNLRAATRIENMQNQLLRSDSTSGIKGVYWLKRNKKWRAHIQVNRKKRHIGLFSNIDEARRAYNEAAAREFGAFMRAS